MTAGFDEGFVKFVHVIIHFGNISMTTIVQ